jgi:hypothetical protein
LHHNIPQEVNVKVVSAANDDDDDDDDDVTTKACKEHKLFGGLRKNTTHKSDFHI